MGEALGSITSTEREKKKLTLTSLLTPRQNKVLMKEFSFLFAL